MARYPELSNLVNIPTKELRDMYTEIQRWGSLRMALQKDGGR